MKKLFDRNISLEDKLCMVADFICKYEKTSIVIACIFWYIVITEVFL